MSIDETLIYVLIPWMFHIFIFSNLASWKCDFCS